MQESKEGRLHSCDCRKCIKCLKAWKDDMQVYPSSTLHTTPCCSHTLCEENLNYYFPPCPGASPLNAWLKSNSIMLPHSNWCIFYSWFEFSKSKIDERKLKCDSEFFATFGVIPWTREQTKENFRWLNTPQVSSLHWHIVLLSNHQWFKNPGVLRKQGWTPVTRQSSSTPQCLYRGYSIS